VGGGGGGWGGGGGGGSGGEGGKGGGGGGGGRAWFVTQEGLTDLPSGNRNGSGHCEYLRFFSRRVPDTAGPCVMMAASCCAFGHELSELM